MRLFRFGPGSNARPQNPQLLSSYLIGKRTVDYVQLADGSTRWICNCEDYQTSCSCAQGAWCKHVAKAAAIRSIERLTGERVVVRTIARPPQVQGQAEAERSGREPRRPAADSAFRDAPGEAGSAVGVLQ